MVTTTPRLGRGLEALMGSTLSTAETSKVRIDQIKPNPHQPRKLFDADELSQLSESIKSFGVLQPIVVRNGADGYELIAGERRWRAAQAAGLSEIPVQVVDFNDQQTFEAALVENIQRADLNPIEKAVGFKEYLERYGQTQEQLATRLGVDRTTVTNLLGLLNLPADVQNWVRVGQLSLGHAKVIKGLRGADEQSAIAKETIARNLSVHALEALIKERKAEPAAAPRSPSAEPPAKSAHVSAIEDEMRQKLAVRFQVKLKDQGSGQMVIAFDNNDDFERIIGQLRK